jgi:hypothetical protein
MASVAVPLFATMPAERLSGVKTDLYTHQQYPNYRGQNPRFIGLLRQEKTTQAVRAKSVLFRIIPDKSRAVNKRVYNF